MTRVMAGREGREYNTLDVQEVGAQMVGAVGSLQDKKLEEKVYLSLVKASAKLEAELNRLFRQYELTNATHLILRILETAGHEGRSCGQIAEQLVAEVPDMTRLLDRLDRLGYVKRERSKADRRMVRVTITEKGAHTLVALREPVGEFYRSAFAHLPEERQELLLRLLEEVRGESAQVGLESAESGTAAREGE